MKTIETETTSTETQTAVAEAQEQKAPTKAKAAKQARSVALDKPKSGKKAKAPKKGAKAGQKAPKAAKKADAARQGSKTATVIALLQRAKGATLAEIMEETSWQAHSVRGFVSGTLGKKMGLKVDSTKREDGTRVYSIAK
jgi:hypothetical protein